MVDPLHRGFLGRASFVVLLYLIKNAKNSVYFDSLPADCVELIANYPPENKNSKEREFEIREKDKLEFENAISKLANLVEQITGKKSEEKKANLLLLEKFKNHVRSKEPKIGKFENWIRRCFGCY